MKNFFAKMKQAWAEINRLAPKYRNKHLAQLLVFCLIMSYGNIINPLLIKRLFHALELNDLNVLYITCLINVLIVIAFFVLCYINNVYIDLIGFKIEIEAVKNSFDILYRLPYDITSCRYDEAELHNRISNCCDVLTGIFSMVILIISNNIGIILMLIISGSASLILFFFALASVIVGIIFANYESKRQKSYENEKQKTETKLDKILYDFTHQIITILTYQAQNKIIKDYRQNREEAWNYAWKKEKLSLEVSSLTEMISSFFRGGMAFSFYPMRLHNKLADENIASSFSIFDQIRSIAKNYSFPISRFNSNMVILDRADEIYALYYPKDKEQINYLAKKDTYAISAKNVNYNIDEKQIIKNVNLAINIGDRIAIIGSNGCGKSTLIKIICGLYGNYHGNIEIMGNDIENLTNEDRRRFISYIPANSYLYNQSIIENVLMNADDTQILAYGMVKEKSQFDSDMYDHTLTSSLSGGQSQRVNIARGMINDASILIADEPIAGIPLHQGNSIIESLLKRYETSIIVTHHIESLKYFNRVILIEDGNILADSTPAEITDCIEFKKWSGL